MPVIAFQLAQVRRAIEQGAASVVSLDEHTWSCWRRPLSPADCHVLKLMDVSDDRRWTFALDAMPTVLGIYVDASERYWHAHLLGGPQAGRWALEPLGAVERVIERYGGVPELEPLDYKR